MPYSPSDWRAWVLLAAAAATSIADLLLKFFP